MNKKCFIGVDYQLDFIEGGKLAVNGGMTCANNCAKFLSNNEFRMKIFTCDWHPFNHSSFKDFGGQWPSHCVEHTVGASIYSDVLETAFSTDGITKILTKGTDFSTEEYSIFRNPMANLYLQNIFGVADFEEIHVGGIAGDYCVLNTLKDLILIVDKSKIVVHLDLIASIDGDNHTLIEWCNENGVKCI